METARKIIEARGGGRVERCHTFPTIGSYTNAAHSWGVAMLMWYIWPEDFYHLGIVCLSHDIPERLLGDIPAPSLRTVPELRKNLQLIELIISGDLDLPSEHTLTSEDRQKLKACDRLELWIWCHEQLALGNKFAEECIVGLDKIWEKDPLPERAKAAKDQIEKFGIIPEHAITFLERLI